MIIAFHLVQADNMFQAQVNVCPVIIHVKIVMESLLVNVILVNQVMLSIQIGNVQ